mmetsp:Transcript_89958/g.254818  ORF Transcript_89958/g.254818 Transcript_89958/m.254818 type:complete len:201 (-) Transcript_89958:127-729(-)
MPGPCLAAPQPALRPPLGRAAAEQPPEAAELVLHGRRPLGPPLVVKLRRARQLLQVKVVHAGAETEQALDQLHEVDGAGAAPVQEVEELLGISGVDAGVEHVGLEGGVGQAGVKVLVSDLRPRLVDVAGGEEVAGRAQEVRVPVGRGALQRPLHKDTRDDVHHGQQREGHVGDEEQAQERRDAKQGAQRVVPGDARKDGL